MARTFRRPRQAHPIAELNVTNLIDLGFTLLIIFMIATPLIQKEQTIPLNLPQEAKSELSRPPTETEFVAISIDKGGHYYYSGKLVSLAELKNRLSGLAASSKQQPVIRIRADASLAWQQIVSLMSELKKRKLTKVTFDTQASD